MTKDGATLATRLRGGEPLRLLFVKPSAPAEVEAAAYAGFDAVILDAEHGAASPPALEHHLRAADAAGLPALVRIPSADPGWILAVLDAGATGIVVPHVLDGPGASAAVAAAHYPPRGHRGLALTTRAARQGTTTLAEHLDRAAAETIVVVQIEDAEALPRASEILAVDGVDAVLIGANDLSASLGHPGQVDHPDVQAAIDAIVSAAHAAGVGAANVVSTPAQAVAWQSTSGSVAVFVATQLVRDAFAGAARPGSTRAASTGPRAWEPERPAPVVLLPGMLGSERLWSDVVARLIGSCKIRSARIDLDDSVQEMAATVLAAAPARCALVGHSLGAIVALEAQRQAPERVTRLGLVCASARPAGDAQLAAWQELQDRVEQVGFDAVAEEFARTNVREGRGDEADVLSRISAMARDVGPRGFERQLAAQRGRPDSLLALASIVCPVLVVSASDDTVCPPPLQEELAAGIPGARLERLHGCDHMAPLEAPQALADLLRRFVGAPDGAGSDGS